MHTWGSYCDGGCEDQVVECLGYAPVSQAVHQDLVGIPGLVGVEFMEEVVSWVRIVGISLFSQMFIRLLLKEKYWLIRTRNKS